MKYMTSPTLRLELTGIFLLQSKLVVPGHFESSDYVASSWLRLSRVGVTYKTGSGMGWIGFIAPYTFMQFGTTALSLFYTLSSSPLDTH
jgi:hypothetical protein